MDLISLFLFTHKNYEIKSPTKIYDFIVLFHENICWNVEFYPLSFGLIKIVQSPADLQSPISSIIVLPIKSVGLGPYKIRSVGLSGNSTLYIFQAGVITLNSESTPYRKKKKKKNIIF